MAKVVIVGGGFSGVVAAELLAKRVGSEHEITLVSRSLKFVFYPALVRLAFEQCGPDDVVFDLRAAMLDRRIRFVEGEIARIDSQRQHVTFAGGDLIGEMPYDFLVIAMGRRLATERITGFFENAHNLLTIDGARKFGHAARNFSDGRAVIGSCPGGRLPVPVFETAFALARSLDQRGVRKNCRITIVSSEPPDEMFGGVPISEVLNSKLKSHDIELIPDFSVSRVTRNSVIADDGRVIDSELTMLIPPFAGPGPLVGRDLTDEDGYIKVDTTMRAIGSRRTYAAGDCVSSRGPKMGHMAVREAEVAAENIAAEIEGRAPAATYGHELMLLFDACGDESIFAHKDLWTDDPANIKQGRFWAWAKHLQESYWKVKHA